MGHCHCPLGYSCPYCEEEGLGGSEDSGQGCKEKVKEEEGSNGGIAEYFTSFVFFFLKVFLVKLSQRTTDRLQICRNFKSRNLNRKLEITKISDNIVMTLGFALYYTLSYSILFY